jgi:hypothetical protein
MNLMHCFSIQNLKSKFQNPSRSHFKSFNHAQDQGGSRRTTTVIVNYFEDWPPRSNAEIELERRF